MRLSKKMVGTFLFITLVLPILLSTGAFGEALDPADKVPVLKFLTSTPSYDRNRYEAAKMIAENWSKLGIDANVMPLDFTVVSMGTRSEPWDFSCFMHEMSGRAERLDPDNFLYDIFHSSTNRNKGNNRVGLSDPAYDRLAEAQRVEMNPKKRREIVFKCQEFLHDTAVLFPIFYQEFLAAANKERFKGYVMLPGGNLYNVWTMVQAEPLTDDKVLRVVMNVDLDNLNPVSGKAVWNWKIFHLIYDQLVKIDSDLEVVPAAAEKWEVVEPTIVDVTLRRGMTFHDGKPVTVEDVKFTFDAFRKWPAYLGSFAKPIQEVKILDDSKVRFILKKPYAPFVQNTLGTIPILPKHIWEKVESPEDWPNPHPIGSGPLKFVHWRKGEEVKLEKFADFYTPPKIDGMLYIVVGDAEGVLGALETKRADICGKDMSPLHFKMAEKMPHLQTFKMAGHGFKFLGLNARRPPFSDKKFRQAIAHTLNYEDFVDILLDGYGIPGGAGRVIAPSIKSFYDPNIPRYGFSLEKAREMLKAAGYRWDSDGKLYYPKK